jgi:hypothetical protein
MEKAILEFLCGIKSEAIHQKTKVTDIAHGISTLKWQWAGYQP